MTESQHESTAVTNMSLWDIGAALDDINVQFHQVQNLLQIYDEHIENELKFIQEHVKSGSASYFVDRYDLLRSLLEIIQLHVFNASKSLRNQIDILYEVHRAKQQAT